MLIVGTGGQAMDSFEILSQSNQHNSVCFFNNIDLDFRFKENYFKDYPVLNSIEKLKHYFENQPEFILGIGGPRNRNLLYELMITHGGVPFTLVSPKASIGKINNVVGQAVSIMNGVVITINTVIGKGVLINTNATITHDCKISDFVEIGPGANIAGNCTIKENAFIGTGACLLPKITIGENAVVAAGAIVTRDVPPFTMVAGNPAVVKKKLI